MKKLLLTVIVVFGVFAAVKGETKTWNFSMSPFGSVISNASGTFDGLTVGPSVSIDESSKSMDGFSFTHRLKTGGAGYDATVGGTETLPVQRYVSFDVKGDAKVTLYYVSSSSSTARQVIVSDGNKIVKEFTAAETSNLGKIEISYVGAAAKLYVFTRDGGLNLYGIILEDSGQGGGGDPETPLIPGNVITQWRVGDDEVNFPTTAGYSSVTTVQGLTIVPKNPMTGTIPSNMGQIEASSSKTYGDDTYPNRFKFNGGGYSGAADADQTPGSMSPTQRFLTLDVTGTCFITLRGITGSNNSARKVFLTDGTKLIGTFNYPANTEKDENEQIIANIVEESILYQGGFATLYLFCNAACNLYHIYLKEAIPSTSISSVTSSKVVKDTLYYDMLGRQVTASTKGLVIIRTLFEDGTSSSAKVLK